MQDEARHVMFGRLALRDYYPQLTAAERDEREEFCVDACYACVTVLGRGGLGAPRPARRVGPTSATASRSACSAATCSCASCRSEGHRALGPRIVKAFTDMGVLGFADATSMPRWPTTRRPPRTSNKLRWTTSTRWPPRLERCTVTPGSVRAPARSPLDLASP